MRKFYKILLGLIISLGIATNVEAATVSSSISASKSSTKYEYVTDLPVYLNKAGSYYLYVLDNDTYFESKTTLREPNEASDVYAYIVNNSNFTSSSAKNYYIAQVAILWYQDYLNGNDANIPSNIKEYITSNTSDTVCYYINKLVNNAKYYNSKTAAIEFITKEISFTKSGSYYYSNEIEVKTSNLKSTPTISLYNEPKSAKIVNNSIDNNGTGTFQIRIPSSSLENDYEQDFEAYITGTSTESTVYEYSNYGVDKVIYGRVYSNSSKEVEASLPIYIKGITPTKIRIKLVSENDKYISGIKFYIYKGDCSNDICSSSDYISEFTTTTSYTTLSNILESGTYTLVRKTNSSKYDLPSKVAINVEDTTSLQTITITETTNEEIEDNEEIETNNNKVTFAILNTLNDSNNTIYIYKTTGTLVKSYKSTSSYYEISLPEGEYYIVDSKNEIVELSFKISNGKLLVKYSNEYKEVTNIDLDNVIKRYPTDNDDSNTSTDSNITTDTNTSTNTNGGTSSSTTTTIGGITIENKVDVDVEVEWTNDVIDTPITSATSYVKYILGTIILVTGVCLIIKNVKKSKNNN